MSTVRAKFMCVEITKSPGWGDFQVITTFKFVPVSSSDPQSENKKFWGATPSGMVQLGTTKLPESTFELGKEYYLDFTPAEAL